KLIVTQNEGSRIPQDTHFKGCASHSSNRITVSSEVKGHACRKLSISYRSTTKVLSASDSEILVFDDGLGSAAHPRLADSNLLAKVSKWEVESVGLTPSVRSTDIGFGRFEATRGARKDDSVVTRRLHR